MKFMQRGADRAKVEAEKKLEKRLIGESHWRAVYDDSVFSKEKPRRARVVYESSYLKMPKDDADGGALVGRRSFKSFNKQTELASVEAETRFRDTQSAQLEKRTTIDDAEMAKTLASKRDTQDDRVQSLRETNKRPKRSRN
ncbi:hypothetical protein GGI04_000304 [Coemansia thaxteri]|uniref:Uncharacterized protein n=1 Tax=Coemansia thaxteri TaxID=2663907 RepID=A0A9W8BHX6_9FUNG|nr:hypothetical protein H4R26_002916 [Coemansia thaxteri]KAJ2009581.1 hypothetical protein GGI04_000304 [Coemansia thaxteri]KAJ2472440.1 hypothetical protein GGI02_001571 [Coemansia sp. RSA 2322]KAJ2484374.1 hypothetical protein EV174_002475 [Coemansia sp. RSA 2320]